MNLKTSIILPTYNEADHILDLIKAIQNHLTDFPHEILVVDDNSPDGTYQKVLDAQLSDVRAILRTKNKGLANSIREGLEKADGDILLVMDTDFNHPPSDIPFMLESLNRYDCIIGSRYVYGGGMNENFRYYCSWLFNLFVRFVTGSPFTENLSGFFAIHKKKLIDLNFDRIFWGYGDYFIRLLYFLQKRQTKIIQFPVQYGIRPSGQSNTSFLPTLIEYSSATFQLCWEERIMKKTEKLQLQSVFNKEQKHELQNHK